MNFFKIIVSLFFCFQICSCASFKTSKSVVNKTKLTKENLHLLNGSYVTNKEVRSLPIDCFWSGDEFYITKKYTALYRKLIKEETPVSIGLEVLNSKRIKATISVHDSILKTITIKGKIKNGFFEQNRKYHVLPAIIVNSFQNSKFRIGLLENDTIVIDFKRINFGTVYFMSPYKNSTSYVSKLYKG